MSNIQTKIKAAILGTKVDALYEKRKKEKKLVITKDVAAKDVIIKDTITLVYGHPEKPVEKSITDLIEELGQLFTLGNLKPDTIKNSLPDSVAKVLGKILFSVRHIYYLKVDRKILNQNKIVKNDATATQEVKDEYAQVNKPEYAIWLDVMADKSLFTGFPISVDSLSFKVWEANNQKVLDEMEINSAKKLLEDAGVAPSKSED